jgi:hypothetical protein
MSLDIWSSLAPREASHPTHITQICSASFLAFMYSWWQIFQLLLVLC